LSCGRRSKDGITVLVCADMNEKMPLLVTGKSEKPRCFKHGHTDITVVWVHYNYGRSIYTTTIYNGIVHVK
jgi:hypothetical protein